MSGRTFVLEGLRDANRARHGLIDRFLHDLNPASAAIELHETIDQGEERIIAALTDALPCLENRAQLPHEDISGTDLLAAKPLHTATLGVGIPAIAAGPLTFLMCHLNT
jgi:hypothetical protein